MWKSESQWPGSHHAVMKVPFWRSMWLSEPCGVCTATRSRGVVGDVPENFKVSPAVGGGLTEGDGGADLWKASSLLGFEFLKRCLG